MAKQIKIQDLYYIDGQNLPEGADTENIPKTVQDYVREMDDKINWEFFHLDTPFYYDVTQDVSNIIKPFVLQENKWNKN